MATSKTKNEQSLTVEERLNALYQLQTTLSEIDRIKTIRGELPLEVKDLEDSIEGLKTRIAKYEDDVEELRRASVVENEKINECKAKVERYKTQLDEVHNNREYDLLSKEIEFQSLEGLIKAIGIEPSKLCTYCWNGKE